MTRYQVENAVRKIDGYYLPRPNESKEEAFSRAKSETITRLQDDLNDVKEMSLSDFKSLMGNSE